MLKNYLMALPVLFFAFNASSPLAEETPTTLTIDHAKIQCLVGTEEPIISTTSGHDDLAKFRIRCLSPRRTKELRSTLEFAGIDEQGHSPCIAVPKSPSFILLFNDNEIHCNKETIVISLL